MLTSPPCIDRLVGCSSTTPPRRERGVFQATLDGDDSGLSRSSFSSSRARVTSTLGAASDTLASKAQGALKEATISASVSAGRMAKYALSIRHAGVETYRNIVVRHGPVPFGAVFRSDQSSKNCMLQGEFVECTRDLGPGETADITLAYDARLGFSCDTARSLRTVSFAEEGALSYASRLITGVTCRMEDAASGAVAPGSTVTPAVLNPDGSTVVFSEPQMFKSYDGTLPQTGARGDVFAAVLADPIPQRVVTSPEGSQFGMSFLLMTITLCVASMLWVIFRKRSWCMARG